ncbi:MAG: hypothetical protein D4R64_15195 [Porphyromonadaceae bacterium]|nr:MAG: hypothetical protein D4R64_15195 [Porphyromonadaceae bacterium]
MKTINLIKIAAVILLGITLNGQAQADNDKFSRNARPAFSQMTHSVKLTGEDIRNMQMLLSQTDAVHISWNNHELKFALREGDVPEYTIRFEVINDEPVEDWMFESGYLSEESAGAIESWMLETDYLNEEVQPLENWMFSESRLSEIASECSLESWMFEDNYLSK